MPEPARILVVEDDAFQIGLVTRLLEEDGHEVLTVPTGAQAIDTAELESPDLIFMDVGLVGGMDGVEAAVLVRKRTGVPVVFLTGKTDPETLARAREAEPLGYLLKPLEPAQLRATVEIALNLARMERERREYRARLAEAEATIAELRARLGEDGAA